MSAPVDTIYAWNRSIATRTLDGTAFILLGSRMLSLNATGTRIWELFENGATVAQAAGAIVAEFETTEEVAMADTQSFVDDLLERQILVPQGAGGGPEPAAAHTTE